MAEYTPGPWRVLVDGYHGGMAVTDESGRNRVAMFPRYWLAHDEANAALIAAAPDLLEALIRAERKLSAYVGVCSGDKELTTTVLPMARAAIAKATAAPAAEREGREMNGIRRPVAMTDEAGSLTVICDDGTIWYLERQEWKQLRCGPIPGTEAAPAGMTTRHVRPATRLESHD